MTNLYSIRKKIFKTNFFFYLKPKKSPLQKSITDYMKRRSCEDDMISIVGGDWRFPKDMKFCPECGPGGAELVRSELIAHYKKQVTKNHRLDCIGHICG